MRKTVYFFGNLGVEFFPNDSGEYASAYTFRKRAGGRAARTALGFSRLNGKAALAGAVGQDVFGDWLSEYFSAIGIDVTNVKTVPGQKTQIAFISQTLRGEQAVWSCKPDFQTCVMTGDFHFNAGDTLVVMSELLLSSNGREAASRAAALAADKGCDVCLVVSFDKESDQMETGLRESICAFAEKADILYVSLKGTKLLFPDLSEDTVKDVFPKSPVVFMSIDSQNAVYYSSSENVHETFSKSVGASGSAYESPFFAALLYKYLCGEPANDLKNKAKQAGEISEVLNFAQATAALATTSHDGVYSMPSLAEVEEYLFNGEIGAFTIENAMKSLEKNNATAKNSYYRLNYHIMAPSGWINDPNGLIQFNGMYHVFYQHHPYSPEWGPMHWGHAVSSDLVHWKHLPVALAPDCNYEKGCFSGSAVDNNGKLSLIYTAHDDERSPKEVQCVAESTDGIHFTKYNNNPVISHLPAGASEDFRDPKAWFEDGKWNLLIGSGKSGKGKALLYQSDDFHTWNYIGVLCESDGTLGDMWECPDFFPLGDKHVLVVSPMNMKGGKNIYIIGRYDKAKHRLIPEEIQEIDNGHDFYAAQTFADANGRRILIAWMDMWGSEFPTQKDGWAGALTVPRELRLEDGQICAEPVKETVKLRGGLLADLSFHLAKKEKHVLSAVKGDSLELNIHVFFDDPACTGFGVCLRKAKEGKEETLLHYDIEREQLSVNTKNSGKGDKRISVGHLKKMDNGLELRILIDKSSVELFANKGRLTMSERIYPENTSVNYDLFCENGSCFVKQVRAWQLNNIWEIN